MNKFIVYLLGVISGLALSYAFASHEQAATPTDSEIKGLEIFSEPADYMDYTQFHISQVLEDGYALARADEILGPHVFIIPNENQHFYDNQTINLAENQCAQHVGTYKYKDNFNSNKTVPAIKIVNGAESPLRKSSKANNGITLFDKPGECVSRRNFEIQKVLDSGDAIALEIHDNIAGHIFTSDLEVLFLAKDGNSFYEKQIVKVPSGKCARQIGTYKYEHRYSDTKVIPIVKIM
ncbi:MAG: hypothetical protein NC102_03100 [Clostridium sp.]|nr:hypothetical protein [Clostridium sp.]